MGTGLGYLVVTWTLKSGTESCPNLRHSTVPRQSTSYSFVPEVGANFFNDFTVTWLQPTRTQPLQEHLLGSVVRLRKHCTSTHVGGHPITDVARRDDTVSTGFHIRSTTASTGTGSESTTRQRQCDVTKWKKVDASMSSALNRTEESTGAIRDRRVEFMTEDK